MSVGGVAARFPSRQREQPQPSENRFWELLKRYSPSQGWATAVFLLLALFAVGDSITAADWVDTPGLFGVIFTGALTGLVLAKVRLHAIILHPMSLVIGFVVVVWQTSSLIEGTSIIDQVQGLWNRLDAWIDVAASEDGISTDLLPLTLLIITAAWLMGYISSWFIFRYNNVWVGVVLMGTAMLTNLSFLPDRFASRFFLYLFLAMILVVRMNVIQHQEKWSKSDVGFSLTSGWLTIHATVWFSIVVLVLAAVLPLKVVVSRPLADGWKYARTPIELLEDDFTRLFSALPSRKNTTGRLFGKSLPFLGKISFDGEVVGYAETDYPSYWLSQTYSRYTSRGWISGRTNEIAIGPEILPPPRADSFKRVVETQSLQLTFDTKDFLTGGIIGGVSRNGTVAALEPKQFIINIRDSSNDDLLPDDIRLLAEHLRVELNPPPNQFIESFVSTILPQDLVLDNVSPNSNTQNRSRINSVTVERKAPIAPEIVSFRFDDKIKKNEPYTMVSFVSVATDDDLRGARTDYSNFIKDHYLQLPPDLPKRVRDLAENITGGADTPLDKALAIQSYLRSDRFIYSQDINAPPAEADGVDYFLFETKTGYSDYFGSSMAVLLRAVGVPTRMAAGYAPGEFDGSIQRRVIRDFDSHGWTQAYFPDFGWIDFEPTPRWALSQRSFLTGPGAGNFPDRLDNPLAGDDPEDEIDLIFEGLVFDESTVNSTPSSSFNPAPILIPLFGGLGGLALVYVILQTIWSYGLSNASAIESAYTKMSRLGSLAGLGRSANQTPIEFAGNISGAIPKIAPEARQIALAYAGTRYGHKETSEAEQQELDEAWKSMRGSLVKRALRRLIPTSWG